METPPYSESECTMHGNGMAWHGGSHGDGGDALHGNRTAASYKLVREEDWLGVGFPTKLKFQNSMPTSLIF